MITWPDWLATSVIWVVAEPKVIAADAPLVTLYRKAKTLGRIVCGRNRGDRWEPLPEMATNPKGQRHPP